MVWAGEKGHRTVGGSGEETWKGLERGKGPGTCPEEKMGKGLGQGAVKWLGKGMRQGQGCVCLPCLHKFPKNPKTFPCSPSYIESICTE